jgi:hypothetical protein
MCNWPAAMRSACRDAVEVFGRQRRQRAAREPRHAPLVGRAGQREQQRYRHAGAAPVLLRAHDRRFMHAAGARPVVPRLRIERTQRAAAAQVRHARAVARALWPLHVGQRQRVVDAVTFDLQLAGRDAQLHALRACRDAVEVFGRQRVL